MSENLHVALGVIEQQREAGWPDMHPEDFCHRCGSRNVRSWSTPNEVWNAALGKDSPIACPQCLSEAWEAKHGLTTWRIEPVTADERGRTHG